MDEPSAGRDVPEAPAASDEVVEPREDLVETHDDLTAVDSILDLGLAIDETNVAKLFKVVVIKLHNVGKLGGSSQSEIGHNIKNCQCAKMLQEMLNYFHFLLSDLNKLYHQTNTSDS